MRAGFKLDSKVKLLATSGASREALTLASRPRQLPCQTAPPSCVRGDQPPLLTPPHLHRSNQSEGSALQLYQCASSACCRGRDELLRAVTSSPHTLLHSFLALLTPTRTNLCYSTSPGPESGKISSRKRWKEQTRERKEWAKSSWKGFLCWVPLTGFSFPCESSPAPFLCSSSVSPLPFGEETTPPLGLPLLWGKQLPAIALRPDCGGGNNSLPLSPPTP